MATSRIAIIGGGAAGMMVAATLLELGCPAEIHLFEKNPSLGKKVIISGGGRCNVTTGITDTVLLNQKYIRGQRFLRAALAAFPPDRVKVWFERHGVPLKIEDDNRVFPQSDKGEDIVALFVRLFAQGKVTVHLGESILSLKKTGEYFDLVSTKSVYQFDAVVLTTGGNAYRHTGSTGDGYAFAQSCGHTVTTLGPSLNSFEAADQWCKELSGIALPQAALAYQSKRVEGPFLFTHFGITGPVTFAFSAHVAFEPITASQPLVVSLYPLGYATFDHWEANFLDLMATAPRKSLQTVLHTYLPKRLVLALLALAHLDPSIEMHQLTKAGRHALVHLFTGGLKITLLSRRPGDEFVTAGGVPTTEVNYKTMASKVCPGLYFGGELLDVDGVTGGFNLQVAWATGRIAGQALAKKYLPN
ncbi:aminoacetone oxidase family FAD-binding enzyme [Candidatus Gracilibacteria bacterium]|nr:aminoacetone oxidase family FAD-binding enzyme [Candidatus Gracilibacteria bacterium]